jgi:hypothetical protein
MPDRKLIYILERCAYGVAACALIYLIRWIASLF